MEEIMSMIFHGFKLVKELESDLPERPPESLSGSLDSIASTFGEANERLKNLLVGPNWPEPASGSGQMIAQMGHSGLMQEYWLRPSTTVVSQSMDTGVMQTQLMAAAAAEVEAEGGSASSTATRPRRRNKEGEREETVLVAAPRMGNTEVPPDDNYTWRKYGQKEILGSRFPRAYYRCTHQKLYNCPAKKQVQRLDHDPFTFRVTYRGSHTCHVSATAPVSSASAADYPAEVADMANAMFNPRVFNMDFIFPFHDQDRDRLGRSSGGE